MSDINRRRFIQSMAILAAATATTGCTNISRHSNLLKTSVQGLSTQGLVVPKMNIVRVAFIGVGQRGVGAVKHFCHIEGVEIKAICDIHDEVVDRAVKIVVDKGFSKPDTYGNNEDDYKRMLEREDIDIVIISTPWKWHTPMSVDTMESGKHAFVEVPAAVSVEEAWQLVNTSERTQKNCMMLENVCYGRDELMVLNMVRQGVFGEMLHGEAAYIHELRWQMKEIDHKTGSWRTQWHSKVNGNLYPTQV
jgi:predicted dehydrogenase